MARRPMPEDKAALFGYIEPNKAVSLWDEWDAKEARLSPASFFNFVAQEETTKAPLVTRPHQQVFFDFVAHPAHRKCVVFMPPGASKTFCSGILTLFLLGHEPTERGAIVSATQGQAAKPLAMVRDYIETNNNLKLVFPALRKSERSSDKWTQTAITVDRPPAIRDPSLVAVGVDGALPGSRLSWIVVDDILDRENTATHDQREKVYDYFDTTVLSRGDLETARYIVTNTAHHPDDLQHRLIKKGWPGLKITISGNVYLYNTDWDTPLIRPSEHGPKDIEGPYRLIGNDRLHPSGFDEKDELSVWPDKFTRKVIVDLKRDHSPRRYNQLYEQQSTDKASQKCQDEWIEACKSHGTTLVSEYKGSNYTATGVDLAVQIGEENDFTAFVTVEFRPDGMRRLLDVEIGQWHGPDIVDKIIDKTARYKSVVRVENNGCFVGGTPILTKRGYVPIETVEVGDLVWTHAARWKPVVDTIKGHGRLGCVAKVRGTPAVTVTPNHWMWMREAGRTSGRKGGHYRPMGDPSWVSVGFPEKPAYVAIAIPKWDPQEAVIEVGGVRTPIDTELAVLLGLYQAEGSSTKRQVSLTFNVKETHLVEFTIKALKRLTRGKVSTFNGVGTTRVVANDTKLAAYFQRFGKLAEKAPPMVCFGWPLSVRLEMVRGWLMGDGCMLVNNKHTAPSLHLEGSSISRNWMLFARSTLLQAGYRARLSTPVRGGVQSIMGRVVTRSPIQLIALPSEDSVRLQMTMNTLVEKNHWPMIECRVRDSNSPIVIEGEHAWSKLITPTPGGPFEEIDTDVYNLVVDEDASYVANDMVVHNSQAYILQFTRKANKSVRVVPHVTGRNKAHPEYGVEGIFIEFKNGAWMLPCDRHGNFCEPVQELVNQCLHFTPAKHTGDALMALWFAVEQGRKIAAFSGMGTGGRVGMMMR
jgi:hypothetical protein